MKGLSEIKNILPFNEPPITSYAHLANYISILWTSEKSLPWFSDHYIQIVANADAKYDWFTFYDALVTNNIFSYQYCPFSEQFRIDRRDVENNLGFECFTDMIEHYIDKGFYIQSALNQFYLKCSENFKKYDNIHPAFIYGYNNTTKEIHIADFYNSKYSHQTVSYDEINDSYSQFPFKSDAPKWFYATSFIKYNDYNYEINRDLLKLSINDYLHSRDSFNKYRYSFNYYDKKMYYGLDCYNLLIEHCENAREQLDIRPFHLLYDHKTAMKIRLNYLNQKNILSTKNFESISAQCDEMLNMTLILRNLVLKYNVTLSKSLLEKIIISCQDLKEYDLRFTEALLESID